MFSGLIRPSSEWPIGRSTLQWAEELRPGHLEYLLWMIGLLGHHQGEVFERTEGGIRSLWNSLGPVSMSIVGLTEFVREGSRLDPARTVDWLAAAWDGFDESIERRAALLTEVPAATGANDQVVFPSSFREALERSDHTSWAAPLSESQIVYLLRLLGAFREEALRSSEMRRIVRQPPRRARPDARNALQALSKLSRDGAKVHDAKAEPWEIRTALGYPEDEDWPPQIKRAIDNATPRVWWRWVTCSFKEACILEGFDNHRRPVEGHLASDGTFSVRRPVSSDETPEAITTALLERRPDETLTKLWAVGPDLRTVLYYDAELTTKTRASATIRIRFEGADVSTTWMNPAVSVLWWSETGAP